MRGDLPACGTGARVFSGDVDPFDRAQEEARIAAVPGCQIQATHFCQGGNMRTRYHDQSALRPAQDVLGNGQNTGVIALNADQVSERDPGLMQSPGMKLRGDRTQPENRLATAREQRQKQGQAGANFKRIGHQDVMQAGGFETAAQMVIDRLQACWQRPVGEMRQAPTLQTSDLLAQTRQRVRGHGCSPNREHKENMTTRGAS